MVPEASPFDVRSEPEAVPTPPPYIAPSTPTREQEWDELTDTQKIERLRGVVKFLDESLARERVRNTRFHEYLRKHMHAADGSVVVPIADDIEIAWNISTPSSTWI